MPHKWRISNNYFSNMLTFIIITIEVRMQAAAAQATETGRVTTLIASTTALIQRQ